MGRVRIALRRRLEENREDLEAEILARIQSVTDPAPAGDSEYTAGLRTAVRAALAYGIDAIAADEPPPVPPEVIRQARSAASIGVALDTVLRRYFSGHALVSDFLMGEAARTADISPAGLKDVVRTETEAFENLVRLISDEYVREADSRNRSVEERRGERVRRILTGEPIDMDELGYDFGCWHLGLLATGPEARSTLRTLASTLNRRLLLAPARGSVLWAWLGGQQELASSEVTEAANSCRPAETLLTVGEPCQALSGWRLTHRQAKAAWPIAERGPSPVVRYVDAALLASALSDEVLGGSLHGIYLKPLERERGGGTILRETLSAYFSSGRNISSAAAALQVNRKTVSLRLQLVESSIGQPIDACSAELETAIRLWELRPEPSYPSAA